MKSNFKRLIGIGLVCVMSAAIFAGCSSGTDSGSSSKASSSSSVSSSSKATSSSSAATSSSSKAA